MQSELNTPRYRRDPSLSLSLNSSYTAGGGAYAHPFERVDQNHTCAGDREGERVIRFQIFMSVVLGGSLQVDEVRINKHLQLAVTDDRVLNADEDAVSLFQIPPEIAPLSAAPISVWTWIYQQLVKYLYNPSALSKVFFI